MRRFTPEEVKAAYAKTGLIPERSTWSERQEDGNYSCCGMTAVGVAEGKFAVSEPGLAEDDELGDYLGEDDDPALYEADGLQFCAMKLGVSRDYAEGFIDGFDSRNIHLAVSRSLPEDYRTGVEDGQGAANLLFGKEAA